MAGPRRAAASNIPNDFAATMTLYTPQTSRTLSVSTCHSPLRQRFDFRDLVKFAFPTIGYINTKF